MRINLKYIAAGFSLLLISNVGATTINFSCITSNDATGDACAIAESQLILDVESLDGQALFTFSNTGSSDAFIADIYFMYESIDFLQFDSIENGAGVSFSEGARPKHLPAYHGLPDFSADADKNGSAKSGIDPGESLGILFDLNDAEYDDVLNAMTSGELIIGFHVQGVGLGNEFSESLTNVSAVPAPAAVWLFGSGLLLLVGIIRHRT